MNAIAPLSSPVGALVPRSMQDAMEMARMMATTGFLPREIQNPGGAMFVMEQAMRWNMSPFAVATEVSFISGKPMFSGKIVAAAVQSCGVLNGRLRYDYSGEGDNRTIVVTGTLRGEAEPRDVRVRLGDAKTNNQHWKGQPDQMLAYHGARVWARRHAPEVMLGVYSPEEMDEAPQPAQEPRPVQATVVPQQRPAPPAAQPWPMLGPDGGRRDAASPVQWIRWCEAAIAKLEDGAAVSRWQTDMEEYFEALEVLDAVAVQKVRQAASDRLDAFAVTGGEFVPGDAYEGTT